MQLSIIIPIYNVEKYVEKCIQSIVDNDLEVFEYEIIVVDDESPDNSLNIVKELSKKHSNIKIVSQKNKELGGARNTGIINSIGDYVLFLDSDDWYLKNTLNNLISIANKYNLEILEFAAQGITSNGSISFHFFNTTKQNVLSGVTYYNTIRYLNSACNKLYKRSFLVNNNLFFLEKIYIEDFEFNTRVFLNAKRAMATDFLVAQFLQSENSITRNKDYSKKEKVINDFIQIIQITNNLYLNLKQTCNKESKIFIQERLSFLVSTLFFQLLKYNISYFNSKEIKNQLKFKGIYYVDFPIFDKKKDLFRKIILKNFILYKFLQPFFKFIKQ